MYLFGIKEIKCEEWFKADYSKILTLRLYHSPQKINFCIAKIALHHPIKLKKINHNLAILTAFSNP